MTTAMPASPPAPRPRRRPPHPTASGAAPTALPTAGRSAPAPLPTACPSAPTPLPVTSAPGRQHLTRLVVLLAEALAGRRPAHQLAPILAYPAQTALRVLPRQPHNLRVHSVHLRPVDRTTVEVAATLVTPHRAKALAARVEHTGRGWRFTALHVVGR